MATTTKQPPSNELCSPRELPRSKDARAKKQLILEKKFKLETADAQLRGVFSPDQSAPDDVVRMAKVRLPELEKEYALVLRELDEAEQVEASALALDQEEMRQRFAVHKRQALAELWQILETARPPNARVAQLDELEHQLCGTYLDPLAWPQLLPSTPERPSFFDEWTLRIAGKPQRGVWSESAALNDEST